MHYVIALLTLTLLTNTAMVSAGEIRGDQQIQAFLQKAVKLADKDGDWFPAASIQVLPFVDNSQKFQWVGARWEGPSDGALFVTADNVPLAGWDTGAVLTLTSGPSLEGVGSTTRVLFQSGIGTGYELIETAVVAFMNNRIEILWRHIISEDNVVFPKEPITLTRYNVKFSNDSRNIYITGNKNIYPPSYPPNNSNKPTRIETIPQKSYCWVPNKKRYLSCGK